MLSKMLFSEKRADRGFAILIDNFPVLGRIFPTFYFFQMKKLLLSLGIAPLFFLMGCTAPESTDAPPIDQKKVVQEKLQDAQNTESSNEEGVDNTTQNPDNASDISNETMFDQMGAAQPGDYIAVVKTSLGDITIRLFTNKVPKTVANFVQHAQDGYYNGVIFHRVISGFMIQGGDPTGTGMGGESIYGGKFDDEFDPDLSNIRGSIAMANSGPNTNGSQFFINQVDNSFLDFNKQPLTSKHAVFGQVIDGMDTVDAITAVPVGAGDKPASDIAIESISVEQVQ